MNIRESSEISPLIRASNILMQTANQRSTNYRFLAQSFYPPDESLSQLIESSRTYKELLQANAWLGKDVEKLQPLLAQITSCQRVSLGHLQQDYESLFGKSFNKVPAHASAYFWRDASNLMDFSKDIKISLHQEYSHFGLIPNPGMEDHVAVQLEFLSFLCEKEARYWEVQSPKTARELRRQQATFFKDHLGRWLPEFFWRIRRHLPGSFYAALAAFGDAWITLDQGPNYFPREQ